MASLILILVISHSFYLSVTNWSDYLCRNETVLDWWQHVSVADENRCPGSARNL